MKCVSCLSGFHASCLGTSCGCSHGSLTVPATAPSPTSIGSNDEVSSDDTDEEGDTRGSVGKRSSSSGKRGNKRDAALKDQQSTGRKRAAREYPLDREAPCEWRNRSNVGGGLFPILGCLSGNQQARHHGPDKSVSNNEAGNVHRICHFCHNRWHAANNEDYDWNSTKVKRHDPQPMTEADKFQAIINQENSKSKQFAKIKD